MQSKLISTFRGFLKGVAGFFTDLFRSIATLPGILRRHPIPFTFLIVKAAISAVTVFSNDWLGVSLAAAEGNTGIHGSYLVWFLLFRMIFLSWLALPIDHPNLSGSLGFWYYNPTPSVTLLVLMLKVPAIVADALSGFLVYRIVLMGTNSRKNAYRGFKIWFYNPLVLLLGEMFGSADIIATMLVLVCVYYFLKERYLVSAIFLVLGTAFRTYPLLMLPILVVSLYQREERRRRNMSIFLTGVLAPIAAAIICLVVIFGARFLFEIIAGQSDYWFFLGYFIWLADTSHDVQIATTIIMLVLVLLLIYSHKALRKGHLDPSNKDNDVLSYLFLFYLALLAFSYWHPQFLLWVIPFVTIDVGLRKSSMKLFVLFTLTAALGSLTYYGFYFSAWGNALFLIPNYGSLMTELSLGWWQIVSISIQNSYYLQMIARFPFVAVCTVYIAYGLIRLIAPMNNRSAEGHNIKRKGRPARNPAEKIRGASGSVPMIQESRRRA